MRTRPFVSIPHSLPKVSSTPEAAHWLTPLVLACTLLLFYAGTCSAASLAENPTNTIWLHLDDLAINPLTLSLRWKNARFVEPFPSAREALILRRGNVALSLWRALFLRTAYFTSFDVRGVYLDLVRHPDGSLSPFYYADPTNMIIALADASQRRFDRSHASKPRLKRAVRLDTDDEDDNTPVVVPRLIVTNVFITCRDRLSGARLWSLDNLYLTLERFRLPILLNREQWRLAFGASCDGTTNKWFSFDAHFFTNPRNPWAHFAASAANLRLDEPWLDPELLSPGVSTTTVSRAAAHDWFDRCFSNPWHTLWLALDETTPRLASHPTLSNFFARYDHSNILLSAHLSVTFTNHTLAPGFVNLHFTAYNPPATSLFLALSITNAPPWILFHVR